jgi:tetraacyldisaccharide-1-P 4'-kinase
MASIGQAAPAIAMLAAFACTFGGVALIRRGDQRTKGVLMLVMAVVLVGNVLVWTL